MNINSQRPWITPLVVGTFALIAVTGILMFFHLDTGLNKTAHEWLSWAMVIGVVLHLVLNWGPFVRYLKQTTARWVIGACLLVLALSFIPLGGASGEPPFVAPIKALAASPLPLLAGVSNADMQQRLAQAGFPNAPEAASVQQLAGPDLKRQAQVLKQVLQRQSQ
jgi:hypothetical protein